MSKKPPYKLIYETDIDPAWIDGNGHVSDRNYTIVFSDAECMFLEELGAGETYRTELGGHIYTAENHLVFLHEIQVDEKMYVGVGLVDFSDKALHLAFELRNKVGTLCAHHETLLLNVRKNAHQIPKVSPFTAEITKKLIGFEAEFGRISNSPYCGKAIGIRRA
ncbi:MAG: thioesterase family protein [Rhodobacteraceae bacterium]|nr:thioesterase family protein [Paracoccaceae bacterium]